MGVVVAVALDEGDIALLKTYGVAPYAKRIKELEGETQTLANSLDALIGIKESDTGLAHPAMWDMAADKQMLQEAPPLQVARCTKIIASTDKPEDSQYIINIKQIAKFVVGLGVRKKNEQKISMMLD